MIVISHALLFEYCSGLPVDYTSDHDAGSQFSMRVNPCELTGVMRAHKNANERRRARPLDFRRRRDDIHELLFDTGAVPSSCIPSPAARHRRSSGEVVGGCYICATARPS